MPTDADSPGRGGFPPLRPAQLAAGAAVEHHPGSVADPVTQGPPMSVPRSVESARRPMFIRPRNTNIHIHVQGPQDGPPVLLLHSLGTNHHVWDPQAEVLARRFRVIRPDMRGHGLSEAPPGPYGMEDLADDAFAVLDALGVGRCFVGGVSIGGMIAQTMALKAPHRVGGLVLVDTSMATAVPAMWRERAGQVRASGIAPFADAITARWVTQGFAGSPEMQGLRTMLHQTAAEGFAGCAEALATADLSARVGDIAVPSLVIVGDQDQSTPVAAAQALCAALKGTLVVLPDAAHIPNLEQPARLADTMLRFLSAQSS
ncbi:alpha/beta fold hydrolase [Azospirillum sp. Vi22]|nr:alpha/beta fold hydrolase [Azospirillum baldaniorum]